ncbi:MAG: AraC family transcriptional regulator [Gorillibacterium sp.]|nr:AraC family transcriptional regulator [Gorillibacterium sp.]
MDIALWKTVLPPVFNQICQEIQVNDAVIDWVDIIFEQIGSASRCPPHSHTWFEFNYVLTGQMETRFDDEPIQIEQGEFFLIPPGMIHSHSYTRGNPHEGICLRWRIRPGGLASQEDLATSFYSRLCQLDDWKPGSYRDEYGFGSLLERFFEDATMSRSELSLQLLLVCLLDQLCFLQQSLNSSPPSFGISKDSLVRKVEVYLEDFQGCRLNVNDLAASLHMSYGHLSRLYKKRTGITIVERMNQIRLDKARELLLQPGLLISEAAEHAGFGDACYFSKAFKKRYGQSPQAYRQGDQFDEEHLIRGDELLCK